MLAMYSNPDYIFNEQEDIVQYYPYPKPSDILQVW